MTPLDYSPLGSGGGGVAAIPVGGPGGGAAGYPPPPSGGGSLLLPPDYFPPIGATDFFIQGSVTFAAPGGPTQIGADVKLPSGMVGVIRDVNIGISNMTAATVASWSIVINGVSALGGWGGLVIQPRTAGYVSDSYLPESTCIRISDGGLVQLFATLAGTSPNDLAGQLHGWYWPANR